MKKMMHDHFSENLRRECGRFESIARICRGAGLNRQQFNKYLNGDNVPNARTRRRICEYMGIPEEELFRRPDAKNASRAVRSSFQPATWDRARMQGIKDLANLVWPASGDASISNLKVGMYFCYFPLQSYENMLVRSVVKISENAGITSFVRHTFFRLSRQRVGNITQGRNKGIVINTDGETYLLGVGHAQPHHISMLVFPRVQDWCYAEEIVPGNVFRGLALTRGLSQPYSCCVCLEYIGKRPMQLKEKLRTAGVVSCSDPSLNPAVSEIFKTRSSNIPGQLDLPIFEHLVASAEAVVSTKPERQDRLRA